MKSWHANGFKIIFALSIIGLGWVLFFSRAEREIYIKDLSELPRRPVGIINGGDAETRVNLENGRMATLKTLNECFVVSGNLDGENFENFAKVYGMSDGLGEYSKNLYIGTNTLRLLPSWAQKVFEKTRMSNDLASFEGKGGDAFISGLYDRSSSTIIFIIGY